MRRLLALVLVLPTVALALTVPDRVHKWQEAEPSIGSPRHLPANRETNIVMIDTMTSYIRYLFEHQQALVLPAAPGRDDFYLYWAYPDYASAPRMIVFSEGQFTDPSSGS